MRRRPTPGSYWYDTRSGLFGVVGTCALGQMYPGHDLGPLAADASAGSTGVFLNGRELPEIEYLVLCRILGGILEPGRYWLAGNGDAGVEGEPFARVNLLAAARASGFAGGDGGGGGGDNFWSSRFGRGNCNADNTCGYVSLPDGSSVTYGM